MAVLVVAVVAGGLTSMHVALGCRRGGVLESPHSLSASGAVLVYVLATLGPVLLYQGLARFARRLHVELDWQSFRAAASTSSFASAGPGSDHGPSGSTCACTRNFWRNG